MNKHLTLCEGSGKPLGAFTRHEHTFGICQICLRKFTKKDQTPGTATPRHYLGTQAYGPSQKR